jgi:hypothetical protein
MNTTDCLRQIAAQDVMQLEQIAAHAVRIGDQVYFVLKRHLFVTPVVSDLNHRFRRS